MTSAYRSLPSVERLLSDERVTEMASAHSRNVVVELIRLCLADARSEISAGGNAPELQELIATIGERAAAMSAEWPRHVINATGVVLHTNLGRAPLSDDAKEAMLRAAQGYSDLELDLATGRRGSRQAHISELVARATGADAALVVNNNASAVMLGLAAIAVGREVIVSRGEAVEIGGGFRVPDVLQQSGATLVEVGTTNRTYGRDYEAAITENTGALLAVHASNFRVMGFTHAPEIAELVEVGARRGVPVLHDLGSGCLLDSAQFGLMHEPMPQESVKAGVALSFFSGDKLLGGPQAGIIAGKKELVDVVARHPLARAMRIDKLSMAALAATMEHYIREEAVAKVPVWRMISMSADEGKKRASLWAEEIGGGVSISEAESTIGGGSLPGETIPTWVLAINCDALGGVVAVAQRLRSSEHPVMGRIEDERVLLDARTVLPGEDRMLIQTVKRALKGEG